MIRPYDLSGRIFGRLTALSRVESDRHQKSRWLCLCVCGASTTARASDLTRGKIVSCGCHRKELSGARNFLHGLTDTSLHYVWRGMKARCYSPTNTSYKNYGARGITVCERWRHSFNAFLTDMGNRPTSGHSIERIDNDGNYEPSNCKWATRLEQSRNTRRTKRNREEHCGTALVHEMEAA